MPPAAPHGGKGDCLLEYGMPVNYVLFQWTENSARARGHRLGQWEQRENLAVAACTLCKRPATIDFSWEGAVRDEEISGNAVTEDCDAVEAEL
jgi:hypothetical protein